MNILFISAVLPYPLYSGGQVRIYNLLKRLSKKHSITLLSFIRSEKEKKYLKELSFLNRVKTIYRGKAMQPKYLFGALGKYSWLLATYNNKEMKEIINDQLVTNNFDLVHIEPFYVYPSLPKIFIPIVVGEHNIEYSIYEQFIQKSPTPFLRSLLSIDVIKTKKWEEFVWTKATSVVAVSDTDAAVIQKTIQTPIPVISNGVDCSFFTYKKKQVTEKMLSCLFIGDFAWMPNKEAVKRLLTEIWPAILKSFPKGTLTIVGKQFPNVLRSFIDTSITVIDSVDDIRSVYDAHTILLAPMSIGGGTKFKLLEAMASGVIVISTKQGCMGLHVVSKKHYVEANTPEEYTRSIAYVCQHPKEVIDMTSSARKLIETQYNWDSIADKLGDVWQQTKK